MAKFNDKHLKLKDNQRVYFGTGDDSSVWFDGSELRIATVVSGVDPTQDYHLTTKWYVDDEISTTSGVLQDNIDNISHPHHDGLTGLGDDDHQQYTLADGTRAFSATVSGVTPTLDPHLSTKGYVDGEISTLSGSIPTDHDELAGLGDDDHTQYSLADGTRPFTSTVSGVSPTLADHLTTKAYVDAVAIGLAIHAPVDLATTEELTAAYDNGTSGQGATLTNSGTQTSLTVDGVAVTPNDRVLIKDQVDKQYNGIYTVTASGSGSTNWVLTRAEDFDNAPGQEIHDGDFFFVQSGTENENKGYVQTEPDPIVVGTDDIIFSQFSGAGQIEAGDGLTKTGDTLDVNVDGTSIIISGDILSVVASGINAGEIDHDSLLNTHNLTTDIDHDNITNTHNLTTDIDHDQLTNYSSTEHFTVASIDHGSIAGTGDDDHTQYSLADGTRPFSSTVSGVTPTVDAHLTTKQYVDNAIATATGTLTGNHGDLVGLGDDDHTQYSLADGTRPFSATVSGVDPTADAHLATKKYVDDNSGGLHESGRTALALNDSSKAVTFGTSFSDTNYSVSVIMTNTTDGTPSIYPMMVSAKATGGFTVLFSGDIDSNNYVLEWIAKHD